MLTIPHERAFCTAKSPLRDLVACVFPEWSIKWMTSRAPDIIFTVNTHVGIVTLPNIITVSPKIDTQRAIVERVSSVAIVFSIKQGQCTLLGKSSAPHAAARHGYSLFARVCEPRSLFGVLLKIKLCEYKFDATLTSPEWYPARSKRPRPLIDATVLKKV